MDKEIMSLLSICQKAGFLKSGDFSAGNSVQSGQAKAIIMAKNASENTKQKFANKAFYYEIPYLVFSYKEKLSWAIGKDNVAVIAITDEAMALKLAEKIKDNIEKELNEG